jgi:hypothetical protein
VCTQNFQGVPSSRRGFAPSSDRLRCRFRSAIGRARSARVSAGRLFKEASAAFRWSTVFGGNDECPLRADSPRLTRLEAISLGGRFSLYVQVSVTTAHVSFSRGRHIASNSDAAIDWAGRCRCR